MRFDELSLLVPGDELRMRFHERLTVLAGVGALERQGLLSGLLGTLTGAHRRSTTLSYVDATGRRVTLARDSRGEATCTYDDGSPAPDLLAQLGIDADRFEDLCVLGAGDLGLLAPTGIEVEDQELAAARTALATVDGELARARAAALGLGTVADELAEVERRLAIAEDTAGRRRYARLLADLERVRAEASAVRGGAAGAEADQAFLAAGVEVHRLAERWHRAERHLEDVRARWDEGASIDLTSCDDGAPEPDLDADDPAALDDLPPIVVPGLDRLVAQLERAQHHRDALAARLRGLSADRLPEPTGPDVVRLARLDQDPLWDTARQVFQTRIAREQASLELGGLGADGFATETPAIAAELEVAHQAVDEAERLLESRQQQTVVAVSTCGILALFALLFVAWLSPLLIAGAVGAAAWGIGQPRKRLLEARGVEEDVLVRAGIGTYLGFHMRRIDATIDPKARERLRVASLEHRVAQTRWDELAPGVDPSEALDLEWEVRAYAAAIPTLAGAAEQIEAVRAELDAAEPAHRAALAAVLDACEPYGIDDPAVAIRIAAVHPGAGAPPVEPPPVVVAVPLRDELAAAEAEELMARGELDALLGELGFARGDVNARVGALDGALAAARQRQQARRHARPASAVEADLTHLEERVRAEHRPEWTGSLARTPPPPVADEAEIEPLRTRRDELASAHEAAADALPDVALLTERRATLVRRIAVLEADPAPVDDGSIERYLLARLTSVRNTGPVAELPPGEVFVEHREALPLLLDDPFRRVGGTRKIELLQLVERLAIDGQLVYLTDDGDVLDWARTRASAGTLLLVEPSTASID